MLTSNELSPGSRVCLWAEIDTPKLPKVGGKGLSIRILISVRSENHIRGLWISSFSLIREALTRLTVRRSGGGLQQVGRQVRHVGRWRLFQQTSSADMYAYE